MLQLPRATERERENAHRPKLSAPDALIAWTTSAALLAFGIVFFDDAVIMGRTILLLGLLSGANEALKVWAARMGGDHRSLRLVLAIAYAGLVLTGFLCGSARP